MTDERDILQTTPPEGIPGALFAQITKRLLERYPPGSQNPVTATGAGRKAEAAALEILQDMMAFYAAVAEEG